MNRSVFCLLILAFLAFILRPGPVFAARKADLIIPFEIQNNFIILSFHVNGSPELRFIYDSGSEHSLFFERDVAELLQVRITRNIQIFGSDLSQPIEAIVGQGVDFETKNKQKLKADIIVLRENIFHLNEYFGIPISGIAGNSMFRNKIIELDYDRLVMKIHSPEHFDPPDAGYQELPSRWIKGKPYVYPLVRTVREQKEYTTLLFDTGASIGLLLYTNYLQPASMPEKLIPGTMGMGLGGPIEGYIGRVDGIDLSGFSFDNIITHYQKLDTTYLDNDESAKHGIIGNSLISHFNVALDFSRHKLYLKNNRSSKKKMNVDRSGLIIIANGANLNEFEIREVMHNSAGEAAGLKAGDTLYRINGLSAKMYTLGDINNRLASQKRKKVRLVILREGKKLRKTLYLKDVI